LRIAVGLPTNLAGVTGADVLAWARAADAGPFSGVGVLDRVVYDTHEPLVSLAAAAAVTTRVRLLASIVLAPTRETTLLARQAATIDAQSDGRLVLGVGIGIRDDDYRATGHDFHARGRRLEAQLPVLRRIWSQAPAAEDLGVVGPAPARPGGPLLYIGGYTVRTARRIASYGDGFMAPGGGEPAAIAELWRQIEAAWREADRPGRPGWTASSYYALGPDAEDLARAYIMRTYAFDPALAERRLRTIPLGVDAVLDVVRRQADMGADEILLRPVGADLTQLERLADLAASAAG
jgi:alkanesulfonate monooxygenase SsuD/methylene tetrahydromethanopterin reductase-like flavin-dependent oxidoreductase (luciferase family)